jgi:hypothetical protein
VLEKLGFRPAGIRIVAARALAQQVESQTYQLTRTDWTERRAVLSATVPIALPRAGKGLDHEIPRLRQGHDPLRRRRRRLRELPAREVRRVRRA